MTAEKRADSAADGIRCFAGGFRLFMHRGLKRYTVLPILINAVLMAAGMYFAVAWSCDYARALFESFTPAWLHWLIYVVYPVIFLAVAAVSVLLFTTFTLLIGSPFYSLLSERAESVLLGRPVPETPFSRTLKEIPAALLREAAKFAYRLPVLILNLIMLFVPVIGEIVIALTGSWCCAADFTAYAFENNRVPLRETFARIRRHRKACLSFGLCVWLSLLIPGLNIFVIPAAVCGGTLVWTGVMREERDAADGAAAEPGTAGPAA